MLKLVSKGRRLGTPVRCPSCRYPNLGIDIWCEQCGRPLDWKQAQAAPSGPTPLAPAGEAPPAASPIAYCPNCGAPNLVSDNYCPRCGSTMVPPAAIPRVSRPAPRLPRMPGIVLVAAILAILLIVPFAYARLPSGHPVASSSPPAAAIPGVEAKTGLRLAAKCPTNAACLSLVTVTVGKDAAAVVFSTAGSGGRQCAGYVFHRGGAWHLLDVVCGLPDQLSPLVGHIATVHVPRGCANVRSAAGLTAGVVGCLDNGAAIHVDGGPTYADGRLWWHESSGWVAHDFLVGP